MKNFFRVTVWEEGKEIADQLGLCSDKNSRPELFEWYFTFDNEKDALAFSDFLETPSGARKHGMSEWQDDPRER